MHLWWIRVYCPRHVLLSKKVATIGNLLLTALPFFCNEIASLGLLPVDLSNWRCEPLWLGVRHPSAYAWPAKCSWKVVAISPVSTTLSHVRTTMYKAVKSACMFISNDGYGVFLLMALLGSHAWRTLSRNGLTDWEGPCRFIFPCTFSPLCFFASSSFRELQCLQLHESSTQRCALQRFLRHIRFVDSASTIVHH